MPKLDTSFDVINAQQSVFYVLLHKYTSSVFAKKPFATLGALLLGFLIARREQTVFVVVVSICINVFVYTYISSNIGRKAGSIIIR